jgi:hypothetical protein
LQAGDFATAKSVGLPLDIFAQRPAGAARRRRPEQCWRHSSNRRRWPQAINEAWAIVAALTVVGLLCVPLARRSPVPSLE